MAEAVATTPTIWRRKQVLAKYGIGGSTLYARIAAGLWPKPISLGVRAVGWPDSEVEAVVRARIAGKSDDEIRALVIEIERKRTEAAP